MTHFVYPVDLSRDRDGWYLVRFPDLPEALTSGESKAAALREASDCLGEALASRLVHREGIPRPSPAKGRPTVAPPAVIAAKVALTEALRDAGMSNTAFADALGVQEGEVRRLLDPRHASKIGRLEAALARLGKRLVVTVEAA